MRRKPILAAALAALAHMMLGSCDSWPLDDAMPADAAELAIPVPSLTVAPILGAPISASDRLTTAISAEAAARGIRLADANSDGFGYVLEGTASSAQTENGTVIAFAWDLTDADGIRQHRFVETQLIPTRSEDVAWGPAGRPAMDQLADRVADELAGWYGQRQALRAVPQPDRTAQSQPESPQKGAPLRDAYGRITTAAILPASREAAPETPIALQAPPSVHLRQVSGEPKSAPQVLTAAMRTALQAGGAHLVAAPEPDSVIVTGRMVVRPSTAGGDMVTLQWDVTRPDGTDLGTVMQERLFTNGTLETVWGTAGNSAAVPAAEGILSLVSPNRDRAGETATLRQLRGFTQPGAN